IRSEGKLIHVFVCINAHALQSLFELFQTLREDLCFQRHRCVGTAQRPIVDANNLLNVGWDHGTRIGTERHCHCYSLEQQNERHEVCKFAHKTSCTWMLPAALE